MRTVKIQDKEYKYKYSLRSVFVFEEIAGKIFSIKTTMEAYIFYYAMLEANNEDFPMTFKEFVDACDDDSKIAQEMQEYLNEYFTKKASIKNNQEDDSKKN